MAKTLPENNNLKFMEYTQTEDGGAFIYKAQ